MRKLFYSFSKLAFVVSIILISNFFISCDLPPRPAVGVEDQIFVVSDSLEYYELESTLLQVFSKVIYTPQPENLFELTRKNISGLESLKDKKNLIIVAPMNSGSRVSKYINSILDSSVKSMVMEEGEFVFNKYDLWAGNQLVMILTAPDMDQLKQRILEDSENLVYYFQTISNKRLAKSLYSPYYEKKHIQGQLLKECGWTIYVQADFHLAKLDSEECFAWLRRAPGSDMERWIFIHWLDNASPEYLMEDSIRAVRNRLTAQFYTTPDDSAHVEIADDYFMSKEVNFQDNYAIMTQGLWRMNDMSMGGPFVNYTFYDEVSKRVYMLDGSIYAPKYYKKKLIQQVEVLLQSFTLKRDLSEDRIDELLSAVK
jgi:hypothetical protein